MKAIKVELILEDNEDTQYFIMNVLSELSKKYKFKQFVWNKVEYFEK